MESVIHPVSKDHSALVVVIVVELVDRVMMPHLMLKKIKFIILIVFKIGTTRKTC